MPLKQKICLAKQKQFELQQINYIQNDTHVSYKQQQQHILILSLLRENQPKKPYYFFINLRPKNMVTFVKEK